MPVAEHVKQWESLGIVKSASTSTPVRATANLAVPEAALTCQAIMFQALSANTAVVYICDRSNVILTDGVQLGLGPALGAPASQTVTPPSVSFGNPSAPQPLNAADFFILPAVANEGARVLVIR